MPDTPELKPAFWSSLPGILTGVGGIILATTGLITALYSAGVIGTNANSNSNSVPPVNTAVTLASVPSPQPSANPEHDRYKMLAGKWRVVEAPPQDTYFEKAKTVTWEYDAVVKGNLLTLKGQILYVHNLNDRPVDGEKDIRATFETTLTGLGGEGDYSFTPMEGEEVTSAATIRLKDSLTEFEGEVKNDDGKTYKLKGRKLP